MSAIAENQKWTIAYRKPRANRFQRVTNWTGTWHEAVEMAGIFAAANPGLEVYYVSTAAWEAEWTREADREDAGNILVDSGRRVRMVETGSIPADALDAWSAAATDAAEAKLVEGYLEAQRRREPASDAEATAYRRAVERAQYEAEAQPTPDEEEAAAGYEPTEAEIDAGVARWEAERAAVAFYAHERMYDAPTATPIADMLEEERGLALDTCAECRSVGGPCYIHRGNPYVGPDGGRI